MTTIRDSTIARIRELRKQRGMTQQDLADRLSELGERIDRTAIAKIETGTRDISLMEALSCARALDVAPVHLFVPTDSDELIRLGPVEASPDEVRAWIRGQLSLNQDPRVYFSTVPEEEFNASIEVRRH